MMKQLAVATLLLCGAAWAQEPQAPQGMPQRGMQVQHGKFEGPRGPKAELRGPMLMPPGRWWKDADVVKQVGLRDDQVQKIEQIFQDSRLKLVDIHAALEKEEIKLEPMVGAENPDENAVLAQIDRIAAQRTALEKANAQMAFAVRRVLTPDQWKKLKSVRPPMRQFAPMPRPFPRLGGPAGMHTPPQPLPPPQEPGAAPATPPQPQDNDQK